MYLLAWFSFTIILCISVLFATTFRKFIILQGLCTSIYIHKEAFNDNYLIIILPTQVKMYSVNSYHKLEQLIGVLNGQ